LSGNSWIPSFKHLKMPEWVAENKEWGDYSWAWGPELDELDLLLPLLCPSMRWSNMYSTRPDHYQVTHNSQRQNVRSLWNCGLQLEQHIVAIWATFQGFHYSPLLDVERMCCWEDGQQGLPSTETVQVELIVFDLSPLLGSNSLRLSHSLTHWVSEMHMASQLFVIAWRIFTAIALGRYTQGASKSGMFTHALSEVFLLFQWNFWALMGDEKFGCGKVSLLYIPLLSEEFFRA
jgi:hypothetical protein